MKPISIINEIESISIDIPEPTDEEVSAMKKELEKEYNGFKEEMAEYIDTPVGSAINQAYIDAIKDPDDIWCECDEDYDVNYKEEGSLYLGVEKHGYICSHCQKYKQIG